MKITSHIGTPVPLSVPRPRPWGSLPQQDTLLHQPGEAPLEMFANIRLNMVLIEHNSGYLGVHVIAAAIATSKPGEREVEESNDGPH